MKPLVAIGTQLGRYEILAPLGKGGMGEVYRAKDTRLGREVAIKVLPEPFARDAERLARFEREAQAIAALSHPNILSLHDYGTEQGVSFAVMELLEGETLRGRLRRAALPWHAALQIGIAVAEGLAAAHAKGIIHRDLKPENLFLTVDGRVKILDFGLARMEARPSSEAKTVPFLPALTESGMVLGTAGYMAPEQVRGLATDGRSDIFALVCVLYEMVARERPFHGETGADVLVAILHDEPASLPKAGIPVEVAEAIHRCLAKKAEKRFQSAVELAVTLRAMLDVPQVIPLNPPSRPQHKVNDAPMTETLDGSAPSPPTRTTPAATVPPARKRRFPIFKLLLGCSCLVVVLTGLGVGSLVWFAGTYVPKLGDWFKSELARQQQWDEVARFWRPPPANADPERLFPPQVNGYILQKHDTNANVPDLNIEASGRRAIYVYRGISGQIELFVYRATRLEKEALLRRAFEVVAPDDENGHRSNRPRKGKIQGYRSTRGSIEGSFFSYEIGAGPTADQYGIFWWDKDWLFLCRSNDVKDPGAFLKDYLATLSNASETAKK